MSAVKRNSIAAALSVVVTAALWITAAVGAMAFVVLGLGLIASLNGGAVRFPIGGALADGVSPGAFIAGLSVLVVVAPAVIYICRQLNRMLATLAEGDPFVPENAPRLSRIAWAVAIMELARYAMVFLLGAVLDFGDDMDGPRFAINLAAWASVAALLVLSQVFREGARLREEAKMTI